MSACISMNSASPHSNRLDKADQRTLKVGGVTPFTATDFPGKLSTVVFVQGCPWRCGYCHNPHLQERLPHSSLQWDAVLHLLQKRVGLIDAVVFSGGEPTMDPALGDAMRAVRDLGFAIGLHTGGAYPRRLAEVLPLLDWVGMDVKTAFDSYEQVTAIGGSGDPALTSAKAILASGVPHEFRTTVHPTIMSASRVEQLAQSLAALGVYDYAIQLFRAQGCADPAFNAAGMTGYLDADLIARVAALFTRFTLRNA